MMAVLPVTGRDVVLSAAREMTFTRGNFLFAQGDPADSLMIIENGCVAIRLINAEGESVTLGLMGPGDIVGEMGLLMPGHTRTASVEALGYVTVRRFDRDAFERLRTRHPEVNDFFMQILAARADTLSRRVIEAHHSPVERRIARRLLEVGRLFVADLLPVIVPLTQDELAQLSGTTRPTTNLFLKRLQRDGVIQLSRGKIELWNIAALRQRC